MSIRILKKDPSASGKLEEKIKTIPPGERDRLCVVLAYQRGFSVKEIALCFHLSEDTVYGYLQEWVGKKKSKNDPRGGKKSKLSPEQAAELKAHLIEKTYRDVKGIIQYVKNQYQVVYTREGMRDWLKRAGFCYKRPATIPGNLDPKKQEDWIKHYEDLIEKKEPILFTDSVHPAYQSQAVYGWMLKGKTKHLRTTAKQTRVHYTGALMLKDGRAEKMTYIESETVNGEVIVKLLKKIKEEYGDQRVHIVCDRAGAHRSSLVKDYAKKNNIEIVFLPPYSPNLNPIERFWKILREKVCYNKYYPSFKLFKEKVSEFFSEIDCHSEEVQKRINDQFQRFEPDFIQT